MTAEAQIVPMPAREVAVPTPMQMLQMAVERGADVAMLEKLMGLQERWEANEARRAFVAALSAFKAKPPTILKDKHVSFSGQKGTTAYDHATLAQVCSVVGAALSEHGLSHRWEVDQHEGLISVTCVLTHERGHSEKVTLRAGADQSGGKNNIQAVGSTVTYLERYTLLAATGLAAKEQDNDAHIPASLAPITTAQKDELVALLKETDTNTQRLLLHINAGVETLDDLPADKFAAAKAALEGKKQRAPK